MGIEPTLAAWEAAVLPLNYTRVGLHLSGCRGLRKHRRGPRCRPASELLAEGGEQGGVVAAVLRRTHVETDVRVQTEQFGTGAHLQGHVGVVEGLARYGVGQAAGDRLRARERFFGLVFMLHVPGQAAIGRQVVVDLVAGLPAEAGDQRIEALVRVGQRGGQGRLVFGIAVDIDLLRQHADDGAVAERFAGEVVTRADAEAEVAAVGRAGMAAHDRAEPHFAIHVVADHRVAELAVDPGVFAIPAGETAERGVGLVEIAAATAEVVAVAADAAETAVDEVAAGPIDAAGEGRADAVVGVAVAVTLEIGAAVDPPAHAVAVGLAGEMAGNAIGAGAADRGRRVRQQRDLARRFQHRDCVLRQDLVRAAGRMHAIGEQIAVRRIRRHQAGRVAGQRVRGDLRLAGGARDVGEAVRGRRCGDFADQVEGVERDHAQAIAGQGTEERTVVSGGERGALRLRRRALGTEGRRQTEIRHGRDQDVLGAGTLQLADDADFRSHRTGDGGAGRRAGIGDREQIVGAAPDGVQRTTVRASAVGGEMVGDLGGERGDRAQRTGGVDAHAGAASGVVGAGLAITVGAGGGAVEIGQVLRPDESRVGGELAGDRTDAGRQQRAEEAGVGQAVAEEHRLRIRTGREDRCGHCCSRRDQGDRKKTADGPFGPTIERHTPLPNG